MSALLEIEGLTLSLADGTRLLRGLDLTLETSGTLGIVGESGSGKSLTALAILGLLPSAIRATGAIRFASVDIVAADEAALTGLRGRRIGMVFQEPMTSLNPLHTVGAQVAEPLILHEGWDRARALAEAARLLDRVGIERARERLAAHPHTLSGGQRQRVMIAMALACRPALLLADEPTSALDVTVQAELLDLLAELVAEEGMALLLISHDLGVVADLCARTLVLYGGVAMEEGPTAEVLARAAHPYTRGLVGAMPGHGRRGGPLLAIPGSVPPARALAPGCPFHGRCPEGDQRCAADPPPRVATGATVSACWRR